MESRSQFKNLACHSSVSRPIGGGLFCVLEFRSALHLVEHPIVRQGRRAMPRAEVSERFLEEAPVCVPGRATSR